jgi:hypothetical protein
MSTIVGIHVPTWRDVGLYWLCQSLQEDDKPIPSRNVLIAIYRGLALRTWDTMHLHAQYQAILDSWRMLQQCIYVHLALVNDREPVQGVLRLVRSIGYISKGGIENIFDPLPLQSMSESDLGMLIHHIYAHLGAVEQPEQTKKSKKRKNKQQDKTANKVSRLTSSSSANMFSLLADADDDDD